MAIHFNAGNDRFENAFWNGVATFYGDGGDSTYPFVTLDTVAHEVAHGFTEQNSGLIYRDQSGGMNEAFSDISGATAEAYMKEADWLDGQSLMTHKDAMRYFEDPSLDGHSVGSMDTALALTSIAPVASTTEPSICCQTRLVGICENPSKLLLLPIKCTGHLIQHSTQERVA